MPAAAEAKLLGGVRVGRLCYKTQNHRPGLKQAPHAQHSCLHQVHMHTYAAAPSDGRVNGDRHAAGCCCCHPVRAAHATAATARAR
jgi:hypothetical protein